jgi:DNA repair exonuclease SbcCD nuclease subunit
VSAIIISDLHAHQWTRFAITLPNGMNSRLADLFDVLEQVKRYVEEYEPDHLLILGDLTHRRNFVTFSLYGKLMAWLAEIQRLGVSIISLVGNHDIESEGHHALEPLPFMGITVVEQPSWLDLGPLGTNLFVPYLQHDMLKAIQDAPNLLGAPKHNDDAIAFLHYAFDGKVLSNEFAVPSSLKKSEMDDYRQIVLGHIHTPSYEDQGRVRYVGAPWHMDFGDSGDRYVNFLDDSRVWHRLDLKFPRFVTTTYPRLPAPPADMPGFLRVLNTPRQLFGDVKKEALASGWQDVLLVEQSMPVEAVKTLSAATLVNEDMIRDYVQTQYGELDKTTRGEIMALGLKYLREAGQ